MTKLLWANASSFVFIHQFVKFYNTKARPNFNNLLHLRITVLKKISNNKQVIILMQYTLVLINRIQRLATLYMIFMGSALKHPTKFCLIQNTIILVNCSRKDLFSCFCIGENLYIHESNL